MSEIIITGVDGSDTATSAAMVAGRLAAALGGELHVVCAYERNEVDLVQLAGEEFVLSTEASAQAIAAEAGRALVDAYPDLPITAITAPGKPADVLVSHAEAEDAELVVVGNKRVQGLARILGSIATDVAHKAPCDVYIAHTH